MKTLTELKEEHRGDFITYTEFLEISQEAVSLSNFTPKSDLVRDKESFLKHMLRTAIKSREDYKDFNSISAQQVGLPINAVYFRYKPEDKEERDVLLIDPEMNLYSDRAPKFFLKVMKCPTSPIPYYVGLFTRELLVSSSNGVDFKITDTNRDIDPTYSFSAELQKAIWADKGYIPGDDSELLLNYSKTCFYLEDDVDFAKTFDCIIHRDEIEKIVKHIKVIDIMGYHKNGASILIDNFIKLLCQQPDKEWIKVPPINMLRRQDGPFNKTESTFST